MVLAALFRWVVLWDAVCETRTNVRANDDNAVRCTASMRRPPRLEASPSDRIGKGLNATVLQYLPERDRARGSVDVCLERNDDPNSTSTRGSVDYSRLSDAYMFTHRIAKKTIEEVEAFSA